jgi:hypothetical protein
MEKETLKALKGSIKKWEKIEGSTRCLDKGHNNCPLCILFMGAYLPNCSECPVVKKTREQNCWQSPYEQWSAHQDEVHRYAPTSRRHKDCPTCLELATKERKFLESLLPKGER